MTNGSCHSTAESKVQPYRKPLRSARFIRLITCEAGGSVCRTRPKSMRGLSLQVLAGGAVDEGAVAGPAGVLAAVDDEFAPGEDRVDASGDPPALVRRV